MNQAWPKKRLADVCQILGGATPSKKNQKFYGGDIPWATVGDMNVEVITTTEEYITKAAVADCSTNVIPSGSIVMATRVGLGKVCVLGQDTAINQDLKGLTPKNPKELTNRWLYWWLKSKATDIQKAGTGATVQGVKMTFVQELDIPLPPLAEQKRIVALLDEAFAGIDEAKVKAEANLENAHTLFESRLEDAFTSTNTDWTDASLTDVLEKQPQNGWSPPAANHSESGTPVLTLSSVTGFKFKPDKIKHTSAKVDTSKGYWINNGDLVITRSNTPELVGHVAIVAGISVPTIYPDLIMRMTPKQSRATTAFLYYQLRTRKLRKLITGRAQGANPTMKKISNEAVRTLPISLPSLVKQDEIVKGIYVIESASQELSSNFKRTLAALSELKASILAQAFAGELTA